MEVQGAPGPPVASWGLDPLYSSHRKLLNIMIHNSIKVKDRDGLLELYLSGRPIRKVEVTGVVVSKAVMSTRANLGEGVKVTFLVDDLTGIVECTKFLDTSETLDSFAQLGDMLCVKGLLSMYQKSLVIHAHIVETVVEPSREIHHALLSMKLSKQVYTSPHIKSEKCACVRRDICYASILHCRCTMSWDSRDPNCAAREAVVLELIRRHRSGGDASLYTFSRAEILSCPELMHLLVNQTESYGGCSTEDQERSPIELYLEVILDLLQLDGIICAGCVQWTPVSVTPRIDVTGTSFNRFTMLNLQDFYDPVARSVERTLESHGPIPTSTLLKRLCEKCPYILETSWTAYLDRFRVVSVDRTMP